MIHTDFMLDQIRRFLERLAGIRKAVQEGARASAADDLTDLERDIDDLWERTAPDKRGVLVPVKAQVDAEHGMVLANTGAIEAGLERLEAARDRLYPLVLQPEADGRLVELYASIVLNAGATWAAARDLDTARQRLDEALERLESRPTGDEAGAALVSLRVAALQNRAMVAQQRGDWVWAAVDLGSAADQVDAAIAGGKKGLGPLAVDLHHRLAMVHHRQGQFDASVAEARAALAGAESLVEQNWGPGAALWVRAKMILAEVCFEAGFLEQGENELFEALESVPELVDPVLAGIEHYLALWGRSDEALEAGGLPRDEVGDSLAELMAQLDARAPDDALRALVWARYDVIVNDDRAAAEALARQELPEGADSRLAAMRDRMLAVLQASGGSGERP